MAKPDKPEVVSALKVQRDSLHKENLQLKTQIRLLQRHQQEMAQWLDNEIHTWLAAKDTGERDAVADEIHVRAEKMLEEARRYRDQH